MNRANDKTTGVRVLFSGQYWPGANTLYIARAFEMCGAVVRILNESSIYPAEWWSVGGRLTRKALMPLIRYEWNSQLLSLVDSFKPDLMYLSNSGFVTPKTLKVLRSCGIPIMCFYHDVVWSRPGDRFIDKVKFFDLISTTRSWQKPMIMKAGGRAVKVVRFGYDPQVHRPMVAAERAVKHYKADVTFVGTYENRRSQDLRHMLTDDFTHKFRLWGGFWDRLPKSSPIIPFWQERWVHEQEIPVIYSTSKVALHWLAQEPGSSDVFLRLGDQHNSRTFQIPACGGALMLAQRTQEHLGFFKEDEEAVYFDDVHELKEKLDYWLDPSRDKLRLNMVSAARERCVSEDYTYIPVVRGYLRYFDLPVSNEDRGS